MSDAPENNKPTNPTVNTTDELDINTDIQSETLIVPPPGFRERLEAAQRARANEIRASVVVPTQLPRFQQQTVPDEEALKPTTLNVPSEPTSPNVAGDKAPSAL